MRPNVINIRKFSCGINRDLAIMQSSRAHMGASSGPVSFAWFRDRPYLMVNTNYFEGGFGENLYFNKSNLSFARRHFRPVDMVELSSDGIFQKFIFADSNQLIYPNVESFEILVDYINQIYPTISNYSNE